MPSPDRRPGNPPASARRPWRAPVLSRLDAREGTQGGADPQFQEDAASYIGTFS